MYGMPGDLASLRQLVGVMRQMELGNGFDPGQTPRKATKPLYDYLAGVGWPVMCQAGYSDFQVEGGRCVLGPQNEAALARMNRAHVFNAIGFGEWGYYFHFLSWNKSWWHTVYGKDFAKFKHLMKPKGLAGYDRCPTSRQECYNVLRDYFMNRKRALLGHIISVTGLSDYEAYAGEWGASVIGLEVAENIPFTQLKFAFARGASRQWRKPWTAQVSPWFIGACTTSGPLRKEDGGWRGLNAGHSLNLCERMWLHAWFAGAAMVTPENSIAIFFQKPSAPWHLTDYGRRAAQEFQFMQTHDRGVPYTPVAIVLDHLDGYDGYAGKPWGILKPTAGDREIRDLFNYQLFPGSDIHHWQTGPNPEANYLRPTPYGEIFDVQLTSASAQMLSSYRVILLAGNITFNNGLIAKLERVLEHGRTLLLTPVQRKAMGRELFARLAKHHGVEVLKPWTNPKTGRLAAISDMRLKQLSRELLPIEVSGDPIEYEENRTTNGWVVELTNNTGVTKKPDQPAVIDSNAIAQVALHPRIPWTSAREWRSNRTYHTPGELRIKVGPGKSAYVEFICP